MSALMACLMEGQLEVPQSRTESWIWLWSQVFLVELGRWVNRFVDLTLGLESDCKRYREDGEEVIAKH